MAKNSKPKSTDQVESTGTNIEGKPTTYNHAQTKRNEAIDAMGNHAVNSVKQVGTGVVDTVKTLFTQGPLSALGVAAQNVTKAGWEAAQFWGNFFKLIFNDTSVYGGNHDIPVNVERPMGMVYAQGNAANAAMGYLPKLSELLITPFEFEESMEFEDNIDTLFESMRFAMRSNLNYNRDQVKVFVLNNIYLYMLCKYYEKRIGYMKYEDPIYPQFKELWRKSEIATGDYGVFQNLSNNDDFDVDTNFANTLDVYEQLCNSSFRFVIPANMKEWIDHYIGSLFVLDDDTMNPKYMSIVLQRIPLYTYNQSSGDGSISKTYLPVPGMRISQLFEVVNDFRHSNTYSIIRSDMLKSAVLMNEKTTVADFVDGWLTNYPEYKPVPIIDPTFKQALINAYTSKTAVDNLGNVRLDFIPNNGGDNLTTLLFNGALFNDGVNANIYKAYGCTVKTLTVKIFADSTHPVTLPSGFVQSGPASEIVMAAPFALAMTSDVYSDIFVNVNSTTEGRIYYPNGSAGATGTAIVTRLITDDVDYWGYSAFDDLHFAPGNWFLLPVAKVFDGSTYYLAFIGNTEVPNNTEVTFRGGISGSLYYIYASALQGSGQLMAKLRDAIENGKPTIITDQQKALFAPDVRSMGFTGALTVYHEGLLQRVHVTGNLNNPDITARVGEGQDPVRYNWITDALLINADLGTQYVLGEVSSDSFSVRGGYIFYPQWIFTTLGYCIPVVNHLRIRSSFNNVYNTYEFDKSLQKEDYIPATVNTEDIPVVMAKMISGLTRFIKK